MSPIGTSIPNSDKQEPRRRFALATLSVAVFLLGILINPGAAQAEVLPFGQRVNCADYANLGWYTVPSPFGRERAYNYTLVSSSPTINVSDGRLIQNDLDTTIHTTISSSISKTYSVQTQVGLEVKFNEFLKTTVSVQIVQSRTTQIGVVAALDVAPHSAMIAEYGVAAYDVTYDAQIFWRDGSTCVAYGTQRLTTNAPTTTEGWHFRPA